MTPEHWRQLEDLYHDARRDPEVLAKADPGLRHEVELLLAHDEFDLPTLNCNVGSEDFAAHEPRGFSSPKSIVAGTQLGEYVIGERLGSGGMGVVFRAHDTVLKRPVAVKLLSDELADASARRRFQREAQMASSLNHPHILTVHAAGEYGDCQYLVTEFVDGGTLKDWASTEKRTWKQVLELLIGVADAMAAAHGAGIIHRDIKPANILVARNGYAKLADFGLAKPAEVEPKKEEESPYSTPGVIVGTVAYMSPEQGNGGLIDARSDIFSFGVVLYEMLAGRRPFSGGNDLELLKTIIHGTPEELPLELPVGLCTIVDKTLAKDPAERYQTARDLVVDLRREARPNAEPRARQKGRPSAMRPFGPSIALAVGITSALTFGIVSYWKDKAPSQTANLNASLLPPQATTFVYARNGEGGFALSPDGTMIAFVGRTQGKSQLWVRPLSVAESRLVPGSEGAMRPFWSPDSHWVAFFTPSKLKKHEVANGATVDLCDVPRVTLSGAWGARNVILWSDGKLTDPINRMPDVGGSPEQVPGTNGGYDPEFLPDGRRFVYKEYYRSSNLWLASLEPAEKPHLISETGWRPILSAGHLLSVVDGVVTARPFDTARGAFTGPPFPLNASLAVRAHMGLPISDFSANAAGMLVYPPRTNSLTELRWRDRDGNLLGTLGTVGEYYTPRISPDGELVAFSRSDSNGSDIWLAHPIAKTETRLTFESGVNDYPVWSADSAIVTYAHADTSGTQNIYRKAASGIGISERLTNTTLRPTQQPLDWSRDGRFLLFTQVSSAFETMVLPADGGQPWSFHGKVFGAAHAQFNPGLPRWIAYDFDDSGRREVYVQAFVPGQPASSARWQISTNGGMSPRWRADGKEMFYLALDGKLMSVRVSGRGASFDSSNPELLFNAIPPVMRSPSFDYDVSPDGKHFLMIEPAEKAEHLPLTIVSNWLAR